MTDDRTTTPTPAERARMAERASMPAWFIACVGLGLFGLAASVPLARLAGSPGVDGTLGSIAVVLLLGSQLILVRTRRARFGPTDRRYPTPPTIRLGFIALALLGGLTVTVLTRDGMTVPAVVLAAVLAGFVTAFAAYRNRSVCRAIRAGRSDR